MGKMKKKVPNGWTAKEWEAFNKKYEAEWKRRKDEFAKRMAKLPEEFKYKYSGNLEFYYETGFEGCSAVILHDDRGNHVGPKVDNPNETMTYKSLEWAHFFSKRDPSFLVVTDPDGKELFSGHVTNSREKLSASDYRISFAPEQIELKDWMVWVSKEYRATVWTDDPALAEDEKYQQEKQETKEKWAKQNEQNKISGSDGKDT